MLSLGFIVFSYSIHGANYGYTEAYMRVLKRFYRRDKVFEDA